MRLANTDKNQRYGGTLNTQSSFSGTNHLPPKVPPRRHKYFAQKQAEILTHPNISEEPNTQIPSQRFPSQSPQGYIHDHYSPKLGRFKFGKSKSFDSCTDKERNETQVQTNQRFSGVFNNSTNRKGYDLLSSSSNESVKTKEYKTSLKNKNIIETFVNRKGRNEKSVPNQNKISDKITKVRLTKDKTGTSNRLNLQDKTDVHLKAQRIKTKYSPPPGDVEYIEPALNADSAIDFECVQNNKKLLNFEFDNSLVGYLTSSNMLRAGLKLKERFVLGLSVVAVLFTLLLVIDIQMDYGYSGTYVLPSHGRVRYVQKEDGPGAAYNSFRKRFLQRMNSGGVNMSKEASSLDTISPEQFVSPRFKVKNEIPPKEHDSFSDLFDYVMMDDDDREIHRKSVGRESPVLQKSTGDDLYHHENPTIAELKHFDPER
ncbi:hypothetical protein WA026_010923 [Henosepilachna vigintioctopunctata]|uniref:Uncharacterized protein n=1 Tax=Henosepilachna vigintioctopunctata TaxID=420089 RepID=A0AAW1UY54_9CUCU